MDSKKGAIEVQFNWIFIMIVGAVIIIFFVTLINNQKESSDLEITGTLLVNLESIAKGGTVSVGTATDIDMPPNLPLQNLCTDNSLTFYKSKLQGVNMQYNVLYSPKILSGSKLFTYSLYWKTPYVVTQFLYMTTDSSLFFIVDDNSLIAQKIFEEIPLNADDNKFDDKGNKESVLKYFFDNETTKLLLEADSEFYTNINVVFTNNQSIYDFFEDMPKSKAKISIYSFENDEIEGYNKVDYYEFQKELEYKGQGETMGFPTILGLLYSDDLIEYNCNVKKALSKQVIINELYKEKTISLYNHTEQNIANNLFSPTCLNFYQPSLYDDIKTRSELMIESANKEVYDFSEFESMYDSVKSLQNYNKNLADKSCVVPY